MKKKNIQSIDRALAPPPVSVVFADEKVREAYVELEARKFEDKQVRAEIDQAITLLKIRPFAGKNISQRLWPKEYRAKYGIKNLRKLNLRNGWRLIYTVKNMEIAILAVILEWFDHKNYERRFGYKKN